MAGDEILLDVIYAIGVGCLWLRILFSLRLTRFLGPLIKMINNMLFDIAIFMILFLVDLIIFASVGNLMFVQLDGFKDFYHSMLTLFLAAMGDFEFEHFEDSNKTEYVG